MTSEKAIPEDEKQLFKEVMKDVKPLKSSNRIIKTSVKQKRKQHQTAETQAIIEPRYLYHTEPISKEDALMYAEPGFDQRIVKKLKQGKMPIQRRLDLHGFTSAEAHVLLEAFLQEALAQEKQHLLIIHGKGRQNPNAPEAVLKNLVNQFLRSVPEVLAFCSAQAKHGGKGAVYVLLRKHVNV